MKRYIFNPTVLQLYWKKSKGENILILKDFAYGNTVCWGYSTDYFSVHPGNISHKKACKIVIPYWELQQQVWLTLEEKVKPTLLN